MDGLVIWAGFLGAWLLLALMLMLALGKAVGMSRRYQRARERRT